MSLKAAFRIESMYTYNTDDNINKFARKSE